MTYTTVMDGGIKVGDFVRVRARGLWLNETGVVTRVLHMGKDAPTGVRVMFSSGAESVFRLDEFEFMAREEDA